MIDLHKGDCLEVMDKLIAEGVKVDAIITDPPYGTTACKWDSVIPFDEMWLRLNKLIKPNGAIVLFGSEPFSSALRMSNIKNYKYDWVWEKNLKTGNLNAKRMPMGGHELVHIFAKKSPTYNPQKRKRTNEVKSGNKKNSKTSVYGSQKEEYTDNQSDLINPDTIIKNIKCVHNSSGKVHPTQKPVALMEYLIKTYTNENELVLDFTMGSGTTGVACKNLNRKFIGIELDDKYFDIAKERINA
jgi:site-specific DNA-methyltransferase (adenine-specific)